MVKFTSCLPSKALSQVFLYDSLDVGFNLSDHPSLSIWQDDINSIETKGTVKTYTSPSFGFRYPMNDNKRIA
jgi:hypothetical protein